METTLMKKSFFGKCILIVISVWITSVANAQVPHGSYDTLLQNATNAITWDFQEDWAFTVKSSGSDGDWVGRFDPRQPENQRWTLLTIDGRAPSTKESADYAAEDHNFGASDDGDGDDNALDMVEPGTLQLVAETDDYWLMSFVPTDDDDDEVARKMMQSMLGTVKIMKDGEYLAYIKIHNDKPLRPKVGVKMKTFLMHMTFGPLDDGSIVMQTMEFAIKLSAYVMVRVNEAESLTFSDFEFAG